MVTTTLTGQQRKRSSWNWLGPMAVVIAITLSIPVLIIVGFSFYGETTVWEHLADTVLRRYITNTIVLMLGVSVGVLLLGVGSAWLTSAFDFPGRSLFVWALLLPLAVPAYIIAYTYTGLLDFAGPIQTSIREFTGLSYGEYWFFEIRSLQGAIVMLSLVLYPYVYLLARTAFLEQSVNTIEASRTLGLSVRASFIKVAIPLARPAIATGLTLALMETVADFGTVQFFGVDTFTTGIFRTFYGFGDSVATAQLAATLLTFVAVLVFIERRSRWKARYYATGQQNAHAKRVRLYGTKALGAWCVCFMPLAFGFLIPAGQLGYWAATHASQFDLNFALLVWNSFSLAFLAALIALFVALLLAYAKRVYSTNIVNTSVSIASLGYALPGTIIAIGVIIPLAWLDHQLIAFAKNALMWDIGLLLSGTVFALLIAYTIRFLAISIGAVESGLNKIRPSLDEAGLSLGRKKLWVLTKIHIPLMRGSVLTALLIVFVDVLKELPATLILRPFNYNTLAVRAYELASDERLADAAPASLMIVFVGIAPVILLSRSISAGRPGTN